MNLAKRLLVVFVVVPPFAFLVYKGGWGYSLFWTFFSGVAGWELWRIFKNGGYTPSRLILILGPPLLVMTRFLFGFEYADGFITLLMFVILFFHIYAYEKGLPKAGISFLITIGGLMYLGWLSGYFISLRSLQNGHWWSYLSLVAIWAADSGGYIVGSLIGKHKLARKISPKKTVEGYLGGILFGVVFTGVFAYFFHNAAPEITIQRGLLLGLIISIVAPMGDLGESIIKRQFGVKDSSKILPGHGGIMDRIDSWLWGIPLCYYLIYWLW
ncbi:MAG: CDP-archaeol synthase [Anaerolineaceae bacterium]|nr:CDP-archaeol synthase [Anaerolineaceae bacterium]